MTELLLSFLPFFTLVALGWWAGRSGLLPLGSISGLNVLVLYFALPSVFFQLSAAGALVQSVVPGLLLAYALAGASLVALVLWAGRRLPRPGTGLLALGTAFPNSGFLGLPLLTGLLGPSAAGPVALTLIVDVLLLSSVCLAWAHSQAHHGDPSATRAAVFASLKGALRNPLLWSLVLGTCVHGVGWHVGGPVGRTLNLLAQAASPVALFTLGAMLARAERASAKRRRSVAGSAQARASAALPWPVAVLTAFKLVLHPGLVWGAGWALRQAGMPVPAEGLLALTLVAALPTASNVSMLAERENANPDAVARLVMATTAAALFSLTLWAQGLGVTRG